MVYNSFYNIFYNYFEDSILKILVIIKEMALNQQNILTASQNEGIS